MKFFIRQRDKANDLESPLSRLVFFSLFDELLCFATCA